MMDETTTEKPCGCIVVEDEWSLTITYCPEHVLTDGEFTISSATWEKEINQ